MLIAILLGAVHIAHTTTATLEETVQAAKRHSLVAVPVGHVLARDFAIAHLAEQSLAEWVTVFATGAGEVAR